MSSRERREQREQNQLKRKQLKVIMWIVLIIIGVSIIGILAYSEYDKKKSIVTFTMIPKFRAKETEETKRIMEYQNFLKKILTESMKKYEDTGNHIKILMDFYHEYAFFTVPVNHVTTRSITSSEEEWEKANQDKSFEIVLMGPQYAKYYPNLFFSNQTTIRLIGAFKTQEILGLLGLHEIGHMHDILVGGEDTKNKREYYEGEVRQHLREAQHIKSLNPYVFRKMRKGWNKIEKERGLTTDFYKLVDDLYFQDIKLSQNERSPFYTGCLTACMFEAVLEDYGHDIPKLINAYRSLEQIYRK